MAFLTMYFDGRWKFYTTWRTLGNMLDYYENTSLVVKFKFSLFFNISLNFLPLSTSIGRMEIVCGELNRIPLILVQLFCTGSCFVANVLRWFFLLHRNGYFPLTFEQKRPLVVCRTDKNALLPIGCRLRYCTNALLSIALLHERNMSQ